ncbi:MAG: 5'-deoxynucleotidase [Gammaproteobacteria bacterium]|nr:MAG: 5'-deoxynucleotidase [Gammaproteobacteria bacterium]
MKKMSGFLALIFRMANINRWNTMRCIHNENVLEHSASVTILALLAGKFAIANGKEINMEKLLAKSVLHDIGESIIGDIITPVKNSSENFFKEIKSLEAAAEEKIISTLPQLLQSDFREIMATSGYEDRLIKGCDVYAAYIKCIQEVESGNKREFSDALNTISSTLAELKSELPEIRQLDEHFTEGFKVSVDVLMK